MPATPKHYLGNPDAEFRWFEARYPGSCAGCGDPFEAGSQIGYAASTGEDSRDQLIARACCGDGLGVTDAELMSRNKPVRVMPPGKTARDRCNRCFMIHTAAQGDEC